MFIDLLFDFFNKNGLDFTILCIVITYMFMKFHVVDKDIEEIKQRNKRLKRNVTEDIIQIKEDMQTMNQKHLKEL